MKNLILISAFAILTLVMMNACSKDDANPLSLLVNTYELKITGDVSESYKVNSAWSISDYSSGGATSEYFTVTMIPDDTGANSLATTIMYKSGAGSPAVGTYSVGQYVFGETIPANTFGGTFVPQSVANGSAYIFDSGTVQITGTGDTFVEGKVNIRAHYFFTLLEDSSKTINITGSFFATKVSL